MADINEEFEALIATLRSLFKHADNYPESEILSAAKTTLENIGYDNWNGGTDVYGIYLVVPTNIYAKYEDILTTIEVSIKEKLEPILRKYPNTWLGEVVISPALPKCHDGPPISSYTVTHEDILDAIEAQKNLMISVATGGQRIQEVNEDYISRQETIECGLQERGIENPIPYTSLWDWYGKWSSGDLPSYQSRRTYISELITPLTKLLKNISTSQTHALFIRPTGWNRVDRNIGELRARLAQANTEEQFQTVGLLCSETLITLAQTVYDPNAHPSADVATVSKTDAKRMLDAYLTAMLSGGTNEKARRHAKSAIDFANELIHKRTADFRQSAMCAEATTSIVNLVAIISGQRNPKG